MFHVEHARLPRKAHLQTLVYRFALRVFCVVAWGAVWMFHVEHFFRGAKDLPTLF